MACMRDRAKEIRVRCTLNGNSVTLDAYPMARLLDVLRDEAGLTGAKEGCGEGECGACCIELDGELVNSCLVPALQAEGATIRTIEGLASGENLHAVQQAFITYGGGAMRHLHTRHGAGRGESFEAQASCDGNRNSRGAFGEPLPLHGLHQDIRRRDGGLSRYGSHS